MSRTNDLPQQLYRLSKLGEGHVLFQVLDAYRQKANAKLRSARGDDLIEAKGWAKAIDDLEGDIRRAGQQPAPGTGPSQQRQVIAPLETARGL